MRIDCASGSRGGSRGSTPLPGQTYALLCSAVAGHNQTESRDRYGRQLSRRQWKEDGNKNGSTEEKRGEEGWEKWRESDEEKTKGGEEGRVGVKDAQCVCSVALHQLNEISLAGKNATLGNSGHMKIGQLDVCLALCVCLSSG